MSKPEKNKAGRPPYKATEQTRAQIGLMAAAGLSRHSIYNLMGIDKKTFTKYHEEDYQMGLDRMVSSIAARIYRKAISNDNDALSAGTFLLKTRAGWREQKQVEVSGPNGQPLMQPQVLNVRSLNPEAQAALYQALQVIKAQNEAVDVNPTTEEDT